MTFVDYLLMWVEGYRNRGSEFMAKFVEEMLDSGKTTIENVEQLEREWDVIRSQSVPFSMEFQKAWLIRDSMRELQHWWKFEDKEQLRQWMEK